MKVAILHYSAPPVVGGVEAVIQAHSRLLVEAGYSVTVVAGAGDGGAFSSGVNFVRIAEMDSQHPQILKASQQLEQGRIPVDFEPLASKLEQTLQPILKEADCAIVHNVFTKHFNLPLTVALFRILDRRGIPNCIAWSHDFSWSSPHSSTKVFPGYPWDLLRTYRSDVTQVVVSEARREELAHLYGCSPKQITVIYNGVDADELLGLSSTGKTLVNKLNLLSSDLVLLMPVRITQAKNIEQGIRVTAALKSKGVHPKLVVTGPPDPHDEKSMDYFHQLRKLRNDRNVLDEVRFVCEESGQPDQIYGIDMPVVGELYRTADLVFMPSHREGFGMAVLEAGLVGIPVFSTEIPAAIEIGQEDVFLMAPEDPPEQVAARILDWAESNPTYRLRKRVRQQSTWRAIFFQKVVPLLEKSG